MPWRKAGTACVEELGVGRGDDALGWSGGAGFYTDNSWVGLNFEPCSVALLTGRAAHQALVGHQLFVPCAAHRAAPRPMARWHT